MYSLVIENPQKAFEFLNRYIVHGNGSRVGVPHGLSASACQRLSGKQILKLCGLADEEVSMHTKQLFPNLRLVDEG